MAKKELRTVKKSTQTGRLSREAVRSAVIMVRDGRSTGGPGRLVEERRACAHATRAG